MKLLDLKRAKLLMLYQLIAETEGITDENLSHESLLEF